MNFIQKKYLGLLLLIIVIAFPLIKKDKATSTDKPVVKIGVTLPLSGEYSKIGVAHKAMIQLSVDEFEKTGTKYDYQLLFEDDSLQLKKTQLNLQKFININKVDVFTTIYSGGANVANKTLMDKDIMLFGWVTDPKVSKERDLTFTYASHNKKNADLLVSELKKRNINNVNIFMQNISFFISQLPFIKEAFDKNNIRYNLYKFNPGEKDYRITIIKSQENNAQLSLLQFYAPDLERFAKQLKEVGNKTEVSSMEAFTYSTNKSLFEGKWFVMPAVETSKEYIEKYKKITGFENTESSEYSYNAYKILLKACEKADIKEDGKIDIKQVAKNILAMKTYETSFGTWDINQFGFIATPSVVGTIKNGKLTKAED
jgi:ABC-type branched-subunit amino acid transport system substrate-binding protein